MNSGYPPQIDSTTEVLSRRKRRGVDYACYALQAIVLIMFIIVLIAAGGKDKTFGDKTPTVYAVFVIAYIIYMVLEFFSTSCNYLMHKTSSFGIYNKMQKIFSSFPKISFFCKNYHYEYDSRRRSKHVVVTYKEEYSLPYYSARDISGVFILNCEKELVENKSYIQLELDEQINFADSISYMDYEYCRRDFYMRNRPKDYYMDYYEKRHIPGLQKFNLIKITDKEPCFANILYFILSTVLMCAEFYKIYIDKLCVAQKFTIRKIVSTRYNLNEPQYQNDYQYFMPALDLKTKQYCYQPQEYNYINQDLNQELPTQEEIEMAEKYKSNVPNYEIEKYTYINGDIKVGVVKDDPSYCSKNYNSDIPPGCDQKNKEVFEQFAQKYGEQGLMKYPSL